MLALALAFNISAATLDHFKVLLKTFLCYFHWFLVPVQDPLLLISLNTFLCSTLLFHQVSYLLLKCLVLSVQLVQHFSRVFMVLNVL